MLHLFVYIYLDYLKQKTKKGEKNFDFIIEGQYKVLVSSEAVFDRFTVAQGMCIVMFVLLYYFRSML